MEIEIVEQPLRFRLFGLSASVDNHCYGEVGLRLMNEMWKIVQDAQLTTTGINHWVYLADDRMFVGVELRHTGAATVAEKRSDVSSNFHGIQCTFTSAPITNCRRSGNR